MHVTKIKRIQITNNNVKH